MQEPEADHVRRVLHRLLHTSEANAGAMDECGDALIELRLQAPQRGAFQVSGDSCDLVQQWPPVMVGDYALADAEEGRTSPNELECRWRQLTVTAPKLFNDR